MHDETLADDYFKTAEFCSMCVPQDIRELAAKGTLRLPTAGG
jgi:hypothetical protein